MKININGEITDTSAFNCFCPNDLKQILESAGEDETLEVEITSEGGSVFGGIQIANMLSRHKGKVITHAVGLCASIATVVLMAGDEIVVDDNCFLMIHLPWTMAQGNSNEIAREVEALKKCESAMMGYYRKHSKVDDERIMEYLSDESWFLGSEFSSVFDCKVVPSDKEFDIAAKVKKFKNLDTRIIDKMRKSEMEKTVETVEEVEETKEILDDEGTSKPIEQEVEGEDKPTGEEKTEPTMEDSTDETRDVDAPVENDDEGSTDEDVGAKMAEYEKQIEELRRENEELKAKIESLLEDEGEDESNETVSVEECEKRVSGMQAKMQKHINDFRDQVKAKEKELSKAQAELINLNQTLEKTSKELKELSSAFEAKSNALEMLNASVNKQGEKLPTMQEGLSKCNTPAEKVAFIASGKYIR